MSKAMKKFDVKDIFQRHKKKKQEQREQFLPVERFMEIYMWM